MKLKELRENLNETQISLAKKLNIPYHNYNKYELQQVEPDLETLMKIADFYNVSVDYLIDHKTNNELSNIYLNNEQKQLLEIIIKLNQTNFIKAFSYISGLYAGQN